MRIALAVTLLLTALALAGCSDGGRDSDGDGLRDNTEGDWPALVVDLMTRRVHVETSSDPEVQDTDADGLGDSDEYFQGTDPRSKDTDGDGLTDCQETIHTVQGECEDPAFEGTYDHGYGTNPRRADSDPGPARFVNRPGYFVDETGTIPGRIEWGDGISDGEEVGGYEIDLGQGRTRMVTSSPRDVDSDDDHLEEGEERELGSDPRNGDTDGDACLDGQDPWPNAEETLVLGLKTFTLKVDKDSDGGSDLAFSGHVSGTTFVSPPSGSIRIAKGDNDVSFLSPDPLRPQGCTMMPSYPWAKVQIAASDPDGFNQVEDIDFTSLSAPESGQSFPALWWNVRTGEFAWDPDASARLPVPLKLSGRDADLTLAPAVSFSQAS